MKKERKRFRCLGGMMRNKSFMLLTIATILAVFIGISGCGKSGSKFANLAPTIKITSYEGVDTINQFVVDENGNQVLDENGNPIPNPFYMSATDLEASTPILFQQRVYWHASDSDGTIDGYAYRILDDQGDPIATPGNKYFDDMGAYTPDNVIAKFGTGWILHYKPGANQNIPLSSPNAAKTIWSSKKYALINFPASDSLGNAMDRISRLEVIAIDNRGAITEHSAFRVFKTTSAAPKCNVSTTRGNPDGGKVGMGIRLSFSLQDFDPYLQPTPWYYEFKISKYTYPGNQLISATQWVNTLNQPKLNQYLLTKKKSPVDSLALTNDFNGDTQVSYTEVIGRVYDLAGVVSDTLVYSANGDLLGKSAITFAVKEGFHPRTVIYPQKVYSIGDYHYIDYVDESTPEILPFTIVNGTQRFATPLYRDIADTLTVTHSANLKTWIRWGWWGEYANLNAAGVPSYVNDPYARKVDALLDHETDSNYYSEITYFDIRLNGQPYNTIVGHLHSEPGETKIWRRIPVNSPVGQTVVLTGMAAGVHNFEVRCVDLQDVVDPNPATITFKIVPYIPPNQRSGILVIDDEPSHPNHAPEAIVLQKYQDMLAGFTGNKFFITRGTNQTPGQDTYFDARNRHIAYSDLQKYKMVIHHSDHPLSSSNLLTDHDAFALYVANGGNLVLSGTHLMSSMFDAIIGGAKRTLTTNLGLAYELNSVKSVMGSATGIQVNPFVQKAVGAQSYPTAFVQYQDNNDLANYPKPSFNPVVEPRKGIGFVSYFTNFTGEPIYRLGCKPVSYSANPPSQAQFDQLNDQVIALRKVNSNNRCYLFGFPLIYMSDSSARQLMDKVISEVM